MTTEPREGDRVEAKTWLLGTPVEGIYQGLFPNKPHLAVITSDRGGSPLVDAKSVKVIAAPADEEV